MITLEEHLGAMVHSGNAAGAAAVTSYLWHHGGNPKILTDALGSHHFESFTLASEIAYVAAYLINSPEEPFVPDCREVLSKFNWFLDITLDRILTFLCIRQS